MKTPESDCPARWWHSHAAEDGRTRIICDLCPRDCQLLPGQRGACFVRRNVDNRMVLTTYGRSSGFCIDPIEKKPLYHFYPGSSVLSFGTAGCNLSCKFCQNWEIARSKEVDREMEAATPEGIAGAAQAYGAQAVAFTYNDPVVFAEYAMDTAQACREKGVNTVAVTAGYMHAEPAREFYALMDAANVDLKAFSEKFYSKYCSGHLKPVLDTLLYIYHETSCWLEISCLIIPELNDSDAEIRALSHWVANELGCEVPLHFSAFHPDWKMATLSRTSPQTLIKARGIAKDEGLHYVYTGNIRDTEGGTTFCSECQAALIVRDGYNILRHELPESAVCVHCQEPIAGHFGKRGKPFGIQRFPVRLVGR